jgi:superfamily I DNA and RNA helicase
MEKKERTISVFAISNCGTTIQVTITEEVEDLIYLIYKAINKVKQLELEKEEFKIVHIDSETRRKVPEL